MSKAGMTVEFKYDHNGLRTQKKVTSGGVVTITEYTLHGKLVTHLTRGSDEMHFFYDNEQRPAMVNFNGTLYSYVHNLQGDIVGIVDSSGSLVVEYKYDAWGKPTLVRTLTTAYEALAELNPFRYRGYVYDEEIELYYLENRYFNAVQNRFINEDILLGVEPQILSHNQFSYCANSPLILYDPTGCLYYGPSPERLEEYWRNKLIKETEKKINETLGEDEMGQYANYDKKTISIKRETFDSLPKIVTEAGVLANIAITSLVFDSTAGGIAFSIIEHYANRVNPIAPSLLPGTYKVTQLAYTDENGWWIFKAGRKSYYTVIEGVGNDFEYLAITHSSIYYSFGVTSSAKLLYEMCYIDEHNNFEKVY